ncbi:hypothetical protein TanjilG_06126 [Lupinus angustifolius]|uniref:Uncharacterized protein n=1 Tax=Lupinus angustifolius TaxID=3871 RepID=A0A1J7HML3_LUPAN|nr:hypothetical protein TanjilG_06126 [Lupinus angustifolius]
MKIKKEGSFIQRGVLIHNQVRKIKQESEKNLDWSHGQPEIKSVLRRISRSPLGISGRSISVGES